MTSVINSFALRVGSFLIFLLFFALATPTFMRWMFRFYHKLETYHRPEDEGLFTKIYKLWYYNTLATIAATAVIVMYEPFISGTGVPFNLETIVATAMIITLANFGIRITSYSYHELPDYPVARLREDAHNAGFALMVGVWMLLFIGTGLNIINGDGFFQGPFQPATFLEGLIVSLIIFLFPAILAMVSELWLHLVVNVPEKLIDEYEKTE